MLTNLSSWFDDLERCWKEDYIPTDDDIVHCRVRTIGMMETVFNIEDHILRFIDVGGQKPERKKWFNFFQGVTSILFLVSLSGYDQCLTEDRDAVSAAHSLPSSSLWVEHKLLLIMKESNARCDANMGWDM
jgi:guanine nucleotide-binding protein subunit alpha